MAEENKEILNDDTLPKEPEKTDEAWDWDAAVPQTDTSNIALDDLQTEVNATDASDADNADNADDADETEKSENAEVSEGDGSDDGLCIVCGKPRRRSPSDLYCNECRAKFLKTNYGVGHVILAFVMVIVAALGYFVCTSTVTVSTKLRSAETCLTEKRYNDVLGYCDEIFEATDTLNSGVNSVIKSVNENASTVNLFTEGSRATKLVLEAYAKTMSINYSDRSAFTQAVESYFSDNQLNNPQNAEIKRIYNMIKDVDTTANSLETSLSEFITTEEDGSYSVEYEKAIAHLDAFKTENDMQKSLVNYYRFMMAYYAEKEDSVILGFLEDAYNGAGEYGYLYLSNYLMVAWNTEAYDKVLELADKAIEINKNDSSAYYYMVKTYIIKEDLEAASKACEDLRKANPDGLDYYSTKSEVLRRQGKFEDAVEVCRKGIVAGSDAEIYRQQAIAYMLLSDKENALEAITQSYELAMQDTTNGISLEEVNTVALICFLCDDSETYEEIKSMFEQQNLEFNDTVKNCIKGDITFEDIFMKGTGEI